MRILMLSSFFYPHYGGSQKYMEELYAHLVQAGKSIQVDVICYNTNGALEQEKYRGLNIYRVPCIQILPGQFALPNYFSLIKLINQLVHKHHYDLIHSNTRFFEHSWWVPFLAKKIGAKSILTDHCAYRPLANSRLVTKLAGFVDHCTTSIFARFYDLTMVTSQATLEFGKTIGLKNPQVIYGGVDTKFFRPKTMGRRRKIPGLFLKLTGQNLIITFAGRMIVTKGPQLLLEAAQKLTKKYPQAHFIFAGTGSLYHHLAACSTSQIHFLGALNQGEIAILLANSDIFVHPSNHHEGFPNAILEAGASGCVVLATDRGGTREIILDNQTGLIIEPSMRSLEASLERVMKDNRLRTKLGKALRQKIVKEFDWKIIIKQFVRQGIISKYVILD